MAILKAANRAAKSPAGLKKLLNYVTREEKTEEKLVSAEGDFREYERGYQKDSYSLYQEMMRVKEEYDKNSGRQYAHYIVSFAPGEIEPSKAHELGKELAEQLWPGHQVVIATHTDRSHIHDHLIVNSVSYMDGKKLHTSRKDLERMKETVAGLCVQNGLSVPVKGQHADGTEVEEGEVRTADRNVWKMLESGKNSYLAECAACIAAARSEAASREEYIRIMQTMGWSVEWKDSRKHVTYTDTEGHRIRDSRLADLFSLRIGKEEMELEFERNAAEQESRRRQLAEETGGSGEDRIRAEIEDRERRRSLAEAQQREREAYRAQREQQQGRGRKI